MAQLVFGDVSCTLFRVHSSWGPYFAVREFDTKVIRSPSKFKKGRGPSEQAIRASIRQAILNMNLKSERASKAEIRLMKAQGILGKRAPSCSLLNAEDMIKLLESFGKTRCASDLRVAVADYRRQHPVVPGQEHTELEEEEEKAEGDSDGYTASRDMGSPLYRAGSSQVASSSSGSQLSAFNSTPNTRASEIQAEIAQLQNQLDQEQHDQSGNGTNVELSLGRGDESSGAQKRARPSLPPKSRPSLGYSTDLTKRRRTDSYDKAAGTGATQQRMAQLQAQLAQVQQPGSSSSSLSNMSSLPPKAPSAIHRSGSAPNLLPNSNSGLDTLLSAVVAAHENLRPDPLGVSTTSISSSSSSSSLAPPPINLSKASPLARSSQPLRSFPSRMLSPITTPLSPSAVFRPTPSPPPPTLLPESSSPRSPSTLPSSNSITSLNGYSLMSNGPLSLGPRSSVFGSEDSSQTQSLTSGLDLLRGPSPFNSRVSSSSLMGPKSSPPVSPNPLLSTSYLQSRPPRSPSLTMNEGGLTSLPSLGSFEFTSLPSLPPFSSSLSTGSEGAADRLLAPQLPAPQLSDTTRTLRTYNLAPAPLVPDFPLKADSVGGGSATAITA